VGQFREWTWEEIGGSASPIRAARVLFAVLGDERDRWALWLPVLLGCGIAAYFALDREPVLWIGPSGLALAIVATIAGRRRASLTVLCLAAGIFALGFSVTQLRTVWVAEPVLEKRIGPVEVSGRLLADQRVSHGRRLLLDRLNVQRLAPHRVPARVRITVRRMPADVKPGDRISVRAIVAPPPAPAAPGAFDFSRRAFFERLGGVGFAVSDVRLTERKAPDTLGLVIQGVRQDVTERILRGLDFPANAVAAALMTGERGAIPERVLNAMRDAGLAHLLAISGLHIGLVAGILFFAVRFLLAAIQPVALRYPIKKWSAAAALLGAFLYLLLSGATVPTQRAFLMLAVVLTAVVFDRSAISMRLVAWAAVLVLLIAPESLLSASFQMSFAAVTALVAAYEALSGRFSAWRTGAGPVRKFGLYVSGVLFTTMIAGFATAPFALYHFNKFALYGVAANLVAVPVTGLWIMPWAICAFVLMPLGLEAIALAPMGWGIDAVIAVAETVAGWPGAVAFAPAMPDIGLAAAALGGLWLCLWRRRWRLLGLAGVAAGIASLAFVRPPDVLINETGRLMAVRTHSGGLAISSSRISKFESEIWLRRAGRAAATPWPREGLSSDGRLGCDSLGCIYRPGKHTVALIRHPAALDEDCALATVVISAVPVRGRRCRRAALIVDRFDLWRRGAHALWFERGGIRVENVAAVRGARPWTSRGNDRKRPKSAPRRRESRNQYLR
jgi:competence protein ComEC